MLEKSNNFLFNGALLVLLVLIFVSLLTLKLSVIVSPLDDNGNVEVAVQDNTNIPINLYLTRNLANITLVSPTSIDGDFAIINSPIVPVIDNLVCFKEGEHFYQSEIIGVVSLGGGNYNVSLESPLDFNFSVLGGCSLRSNNLAVDGSVTPIVFDVSPSRLSVDWHVNKVLFHIEDGSVMDSGRFGGINKLSKGIILRLVDGVNKNLLSISSNGDFAEHDATIKYDDKAPSGVYSLISTKIFNGQDNAGVVLYLNSNTSDKLEVIVQDDLSGLDHVHVVAIGHVVE